MHFLKRGKQWEVYIKQDLSQCVCFFHFANGSRQKHSAYMYIPCYQKETFLIIYFFLYYAFFEWKLVKSLWMLLMKFDIWTFWTKHIVCTFWQIHRFFLSLLIFTSTPVNADAIKKNLTHFWPAAVPFVILYFHLPFICSLCVQFAQ